MVRQKMIQVGPLEKQGSVHEIDSCRRNVIDVDAFKPVVILGIQLLVGLANVIAREEGENYKIGIVFYSRLPKKLDLVNRGRAAFAERDDFEPSLWRSQFVVQFFFEKFMKCLLKRDLLPLDVRIADNNNAINSRRFCKTVLAV